MVEAMHKRGLLILATLAWVAPLSAHGPAPAAQVRSQPAKSDCPRHAKAPVRPGSGSVGAHAVAPSTSMPSENSFFALGRSSSVLMP
jgi:hypothetical protein